MGLFCGQFQLGKTSGLMDRISWEQSHLLFGGLLRFARLLTVAALAASLLASAGCASTPAPPSEKVSAYYDANKSLPPEKKLTPVAFIGDSYTFGTGAKNRINRWSTQVSSSLNWSENNFGKGGTGYMTTSQQCAGPCSNYAGSIAEAKAANPAIVIVAGGRNDVSLPPAVLDPAIESFYPDLRAALPNAKIIALSPTWGDKKAPERVNVIGQHIQAAVEAAGGSYVDIGQPLEGHPEFIDPDGVHPNDAGYEALAAAIRASLEKSGLVA